MDSLLEHIRSVHFALIAVCGVVIAAVFLSDDSALRTARADLVAIQGLQSSWDAGLIATLAEKEASVRLYRDWATALQHRNALQLELDAAQTLPTNTPGFDLTRYYVSLEKIWRIGIPDQTNAPAFVRRVAERENAIPLEQLIYLKPPERLKDFEDLWNTIEGGVPVEYISDIERLAFVVDDDARLRVPVRVSPANSSAVVHIGPLGWSHRSKRQFSRAGVFDDLFIAFESSRVLGELQVLTGETSRPRIVLRAKPALTMINAQRAIADRAGMRWAPGTFQQSFPELSAILADFKSIELAQADALLTALEENLADDVELLGVEVPAQALQVWALVVVLLIQAYLGIHLHHYGSLASRARWSLRRGNKREGDGEETATWIGIYPQKIPRVLTIVSACFVPFVLVLGVRMKRLTDETSMADVAITLSLSMIAAAIAWYVQAGLKQAWATIDRC